MANQLGNFFIWLRAAITQQLQNVFLAFGLDTKSGREQGQGGGPPNPDNFYARTARYNLLWSMFENTTYDDLVHFWSKSYKVDNALYPAIRNIYNPTYRIAEFWATHTYTGALDPQAGDGRTIQSGIPIKTTNEALRPVISRLWHDSAWDQNKTVFARMGAVMGDVGLMVVDDTRRQKVYMRVVDPRSIVELDLDPFGHCRYYKIEEWRSDPTMNPLMQPGTTRLVVYSEIAELIDDPNPARRGKKAVRYQTFKENVPYTWDDSPDGPMWIEPYPWVPMRWNNHVKVLLHSKAGWSEIQPAIGKIRELDNIASRLLDMCGKIVDPIWLFKGVQDPAKTGGALRIPSTQATQGEPQPRKNDIPSLYGPSDAGAQALVAPVDLEHVSMIVTNLQNDLKDDFPELVKDIESASGDSSGRAIRYARMRCETKAQNRRPGYDQTLVEVMKMAIAIGGMRGYEGYEAFQEDSAENGDIDFAIGVRSVFSNDPVDLEELDMQFWANAESADRAGCPLPAYLELRGWPKEKIDLVVKARDEQMEQGLPVGRGKQASPQGEAATKASQVNGATSP
jgi:hypothetical protein